MQRMLFDHFCQLSSVAGLAIGKGVSSEDKRNTRLEAGVKFRCKLNQRRCFFSRGEMKSNLLLVISAKNPDFAFAAFGPYLHAKLIHLAVSEFYRRVVARQGQGC